MIKKPSDTNKPRQRKLGEEIFFQQAKGQSNADEVKALIVPFKIKGATKAQTIVCISQNGNFVLLTPETLQALLEWLT